MNSWQRKISEFSFFNTTILEMLLYSMRNTVLLMILHRALRATLNDIEFSLFSFFLFLQINRTETTSLLLSKLFFLFNMNDFLRKFLMRYS